MIDSIIYWFNKYIKPTKIVMTMLTRNEADILEINIKYHLSVGVDFFIITNHNSIDHTSEIIQKYERLGLAKYIFNETDSFEQNKIVTEMAKMAYTDFNATWVINNDTDEFWWTNQLDLKKELKALPKKIDLQFIRRNNFIPRQEDSLCLFYEVMNIRQAISLNVLGKPLPPKAMHRASSTINVSFGNHDAYSVNFKHKSYSETIEIFHFPNRTYKQFENKVYYGTKALINNKEISTDIGITWRFLYELYLNGSLYEYYKKNILTDSEIKDHLFNNTLIEDSRLKDYLLKKCI